MYQVYAPSQPPWKFGQFGALSSARYLVENAATRQAERTEQSPKAYLLQAGRSQFLQLDAPDALSEAPAKGLLP